MAQQQFVVVGASLAGARAAAALREEGFDGQIVLVGAERDRPYERPPLSKDYLRGEVPREKAYVHPEGFYAEHDIELRRSTRATAIDRRAQEVVLDGGERVRFDRLLLTTGAEPRRLQVAGTALDGIRYLRDLNDSDALAQRLRAGGRLVVVGGGWIGLEVAASARQKGLDVTIVEQLSVPLERAVGPELGAIYRDIHRDHGVEVLTGIGVEAFEGRRDVERVRLSDGRTLDCDFAVVGVGVAPRVELAQSAGLEVDDGIVVSQTLESSVPGIFAAGDVASAFHPFYATRIRSEHWANALNQGPAAARNMLGRDEPYERLPYFFSDQYDVAMEYAGYAPQWDEVIFRGDPASREFVAFWLAGGRVVAGMNVNVWDVNDHIKALILSRDVIDVARLRDPGVSLEELAGRPALRDPEEVHATGSAKGFLAQGMNFSRRFVEARFSKADTTPVSQLHRGAASVLQVDGRKLAVHRDPGGSLHALSAVCTHMGCLVGWNAAESTWDCPCHGSRFGVDGAVVQGPAKRPLKTEELVES